MAEVKTNADEDAEKLTLAACGNSCHRQLEELCFAPPVSAIFFSDRCNQISNRSNLGGKDFLWFMV